MSSISTMVSTEEPRDVILFLAGGAKGISYPRLDSIYSRSGWVKVQNNIELLKLIANMVDEGFIVESGGVLIKGANWMSPLFLIEEKYTLR